ncbi:MAG: glycosyltransferase [Candidatus Diapherotrites archaeon]|nr:glycosyltransferase [Candidatus Diapherotrites archaeon]
MSNGFFSEIKSVLDSAFSSLLLFSRPKVTAVIPAFNEEKTIGLVIIAAKATGKIDEILVVDDGSSDKTFEIAKKLGARVLRHDVNKGKGQAIVTGIKNSLGEVIVFLDADWSNISPEKINQILAPVLSSEADFVKASFSRIGGRITEFAAKPMMKILYPNHEFSQPLSGQFAARKSFLENLKIEPKYGIDIGILIDAINHGLRIKEVDVGLLEHKHRPDLEVAESSKQVLETILKKSVYVKKKKKF